MIEITDEKMERQLELKDLAPYLPYGLKMYNKNLAILIERDNKKYNPTTLRTLTTQGLFWVGKEMDSRNLNEDIHKPVLRPLSDLTKEIEHNGEKFVPIDRLKELFINDGSKCCEAYETAYKDIYFNWSETDFKEKVIMLPYEWVQKLHEWNLDTNGLIDAGLAIDINTIKQ